MITIANVINIVSSVQKLLNKVNTIKKAKIILIFGFGLHSTKTIHKFIKVLTVVFS